MIGTKRNKPSVVFVISGFVASTALAVVAAFAQSTAPGTMPEKAVRAVIENFTTAWNAHDAAGLLLLIADDARIYSGVRRAQVSKTEYGMVMSEWFARSENEGVTWQPTVKKVSIVDPAHAVVELEGTMTKPQTLANRGWSGRGGGRWRFEERNGQWWIVETINLY